MENIRTHSDILEKKINGIDGTPSIDITGARVHNLKNINLTIPRNKLVIITGLSGSGKSSLAFDTIYAEGQRRYMETFSAYARHFLGNLERPDVDKISGLSPVIAIEQKTTARNPRSTVGTITEIYDFLRLLYARISDGYSHVTGKKMVRYTADQIIAGIINKFNNRSIIILAPVVKGRKGHYRELFQQLLKQGFLKARIDSVIKDISYREQLNRYQPHDIEIVIDRLQPSPKSAKRVSASVQLALKHGHGTIMIADNFDSMVQDTDLKPGIFYYSRNLMCAESGISYPDPEPNTFSFNSPYGACPKCNGLGTIAEIDLKKIIPDDRLSIRQGALTPVRKFSDGLIIRQLEAIAGKHGFTLDTPVKDIPASGLQTILYGSDEILRVKNISFTHGAQVESNEYRLNFEGLINILLKQNDDLPGASISQWIGTFMHEAACPECHGARLKKESLCFRIHGQNISGLSAMSILNLERWFFEAERLLSDRQRAIGGELIKEINKRIRFLLDVGLEYLSLDRLSGTLSGGESQRIRLATQIGTRLTDVLYILDEPSIGLHQRDNYRLIEALKNLRDGGNSVIVVEHDKQMIESADYIVDLGPRAGKHGGKVMACGDIVQIIAADTLTSDYLAGRKSIPVPDKRRKGSGKFLQINKCSGNNLKNLTVAFPIGTFICVTGVSGSGKSSLVYETMYPVLSRHFYGAETTPLPFGSISGMEHLDKVAEVDQAPIGRTPRSNPATYTGLFTDIRTLFAKLPEAKIRGYKPGRFSFNVKGGRCETCGGGGVKIIEMNFLPDVHVQCDRCRGKHYNNETLEVRYKGKSIGDVLDFPVDQATDFFRDIHFIYHKLKTLQDVGLGYITLGQSSTTLSGGEAQRIKLATELSKRGTGRTLYILDEPTTGLHFEDVRLLLEVLHKLVDKGNTVIVIEHNIEVIKTADYILDMGPEGGEKGGEIICTGMPEEIAKCDGSFTGDFLKPILNNSH